MYLKFIKEENIHETSDRAGFCCIYPGLRKGEEKNVTIKPEEGYGMPDPENIIEVPLANLPNDTKAGITKAK